MNELDPALLRQLRVMARHGDAAPQMLREIIHRLAPTNPDKITLIRYMREAFCLTLQQASPIAGWAADASGELQDAQLNDLLMPEIVKHLTAWDSLDLAPSV